jgi:hypothetical protein
MKTCIDLRSYLLKTKLDAATFARKKDAQAFAKTQGWKNKDVRSAANRFSMFWIVCQSVGDELTYLKRDGSPGSIPWPGLW